MKTLNNYQINVSDVLSSYSGKVGCMCGCNGKYSYSSLNRDAASKNRGYAVSDDEVSDTANKRMVNKFNKIGVVSIDVSHKDGSVNDYVFIEDGNRMNCIYLKKGTLSNLDASKLDIR